MKIFSKHRRKIEPRKRFGSMQFRDKLKQASNYKRTFDSSGEGIKFLSTNSLLKPAKIVSVLVVLVLGYFFVVSDYLQITEVSIQGNHQIATQDIEDVLTTDANSRLIVIKKNNFFLMSRGRVNDLLQESLPAVKEIVKFDRTWPNKLSLEITEHVPGFVIRSNENMFLVDEEGVVVDQVEDSKKLLIADDQITESFARGEALPNQKFAPFVLSMVRSWSTKIKTPIVSMKFPGKSSNEAQFITEQGWSVLFDTGRPVSVQLNDLAVILSRQIKPAELPNLAYIDLRLNKWAYYCFKATPCEQGVRPTEAGATITNE